MSKAIRDRSDLSASRPETRGAPSAVRANKAAHGDLLTYYLLAAFIFVAPSLPMPGMSTLGFISPALVGILGLSICLRVFSGQHVMVANDYSITILAFYLLLIMSDVFSIFLFETKVQLPYLIARIATLIIFVAAVSYQPSASLIERMIEIYCLSIVGLSILVMLEGFGYVELGAEKTYGRTYFGVQLPFRKAVGFPMSDGEFGIMTAPAFIYFLLRMVTGTGSQRRLYYFLGMFLTAMAILISQSRSGWLGLVIALSFVTLLVPRQGVDRVILLMGGVAGAFFIGSQIFDDIFAGLLGEGVLVKNVDDRLNTFFYVNEVIRDSPIFGYGHTNGMANSDLVLARAVHNHFVDAFMYGGIIAFLPTVSLYLLVIVAMGNIAMNRQADDTLRLLSLWMLGSMLMAVTELILYRGFYSEHLPWLIGTSCLIVSLHKGYRRVII